MSAPWGEAEFSRVYDSRRLPAGLVKLEANAEERGALAERFGLISVERLAAEITLTSLGDAVAASGTLDAAIVQTCAVSGEPLPVSLVDEVSVRFVPPRPITHEEVELEEDDLDEVPMDGTSFDLGEAVAQSLALAIDPYATGRNAETVRAQTGLDDPEPTGPFAALAALKKG